MNYFSKNLRLIASAFGLTYDDMTVVMKVSRGTVANYLRSTDPKNPRPRSLLLLADYCGIEEPEILTGEELSTKTALELSSKKRERQFLKRRLILMTIRKTDTTKTRRRTPQAVPEIRC